MRSTLSPAFTSSKIRLMVPFMEEAGNQMIAALMKKTAETGGPIQVECKDLTSRYANDVIASCAFGLKRLKLTLFSKDTTNFFISLVLDTMKNREENNIIRPDMIHLLMEAKKEWSDTDLVAQAVLFFIGGFETISIGMSFTLYELALHPEVQERLAQEIKETHSKSEGKLDFDLIQNMQYLDMVISEVLRLWPPGILLDRICCKDYNMGKPNKHEKRDFILRKGDLIAIPVFSIHRDAKYFPDPEKFNPERFSDENKHLINSMTYMPFGFGPRNCIGSRFALLEIKMLIYQVLLRMEVSPCEKTCIPSKLLSIGLWSPELNMLFLIWAVVLFATLYLYLRSVYTKFSASGVKNPPTIPLLGNVLPLLLRRRHFADDIDVYYNQYPEERFFGRYEFLNPLVVVRDLELIKKIAIKDFEYFIDHRGFSDEKVMNGKTCDQL
ncbi:unnamed protein product [Leptidea sinapis]|uniref:unspecific monooxygenase n=1 Tax=Leptidea sinapis TaxID=189913 RepID=A0A5E4PXU2_9NEOP|nr:unnamed protein product [Leptidea sinapis]